MSRMARPYTCKDAKKDIDFYFSKTENTRKMKKAIQRAIDHMTQGTTVEKHNISCPECWRYYEQMKRKHCGG